MELEASPAQPAAPYWLRFVFGKNPAWTVARILFVIFVSLVLFKFVLVPIRVTGESMFPTFKDGQIKLVNKLAYLKHPPERGDLVAVKFAGDQVFLIKRIVGLPGESYMVQKGEIYINGKKLIEPYAAGKITVPAPGKGLGNLVPIQIGPTQCIIIGDNRSVSESYLEELSRIVGKVL
jgi:signal peptidase I